MAGTHEDAMLMVELAKWGAMIDLGEASRTLYSDDFDPETANVQDPAVHSVLIFNETIGTLVKNGLFNRELANDWLWFAGAWSRVGPAALRARESVGEPRLYENFESLASA
jgi:hypothetical protein